MRQAWLVSVMLALGTGTAAGGPATRVVILLPGQSLNAGTIAGTPSTVQQRERFVVEAYAVDAFGNVDFAYAGPLYGIATSETAPTTGLRLASSISGAGAATSIPAAGGELRISLNGENYRDYLIGPASTGDDVCTAIETAILDGNAGRPLAVDCRFDATTSRYALVMNDERPVARNLLGTYPENTLTVDPAHGLAPTLHLGVAGPPSSDPDDPSEFGARRLVADPSVDLVFDRGFAAFSVGWNTLADLGAGKTLTLDQGGAGLPVESTPFEVVAATFKINTKTALGDGNGRINRVRLVFNQTVDPSNLGSQAGRFTLEDTSQGTALPGTSLTLGAYDLQGYPADMIEVRFGTGLGKTDVQDLQVTYTPPVDPIHSGDTGEALAGGGSPPLVDGAPPVIISAFGQDTDGNNGLDRQTFFFSEPVAFGAGRGVSVSGFEPATDTLPSAVPLPATLLLDVGGDVRLLDLAHPTDPGAGEIPGGSPVADAITIAAREALNRPAYVNFTCEFVDGRYVLRAGIPLRSVSVANSPLADDAAALLRLGTANGGIERLGAGSAVADVDDFIVLSQFQGENLLQGQSEADVVVAASELRVELTNVPNSGTATPTYLWKDNGDMAFLSDRAPVPNAALGGNNVGLAPGFHPSELIRIRDTDNEPDDGVITAPAGLVDLDATDTIPPLLRTNTAGDLTFKWTQVDGPLAVSFDDPDSADTTAQVLRAGIYTFELTVTVLEGGLAPAFNPYVEGGTGELRKQITVDVKKQSPARVVILLPGETLVEGVLTHAEAVEGKAGIGTPGVPYTVHLVCTDVYFNMVDCPPGLSATLTTSDPADAEPALQPLASDGATFTLVPVTPGITVVDDDVLGFSESDDVARSHAVGTTWNPVASRVPGILASMELTWLPDPRPVTWNVYIGELPIRDLDRDGWPDDDYGICSTSQDPDPTDTSFVDLAVPPPGEGLFYLGTMVLDGQETALGLSSVGLLRLAAVPCP